MKFCRVAVVFLYCSCVDDCYSQIFFNRYNFMLMSLQELCSSCATVLVQDCGPLQ